MRRRRSASGGYLAPAASLPPHITRKEARAYLSALVKDDPDSIGMVMASFKALACAAD